jgi:myo-inositol-1-phosphate synthase
MGDINIAIAGIGNCCSSFIQGIEFYNNNERKVGLIHEKIGSYEVTDLNYVAAFDIDKNKVGKDLSEAIFSAPNKAPRYMKINPMGVKVEMGHAMDPIDEKSMSVFRKADMDPVDIVQVLKLKKVDVFVNLISGGSDKASQFYARACLEAGCAFLNATPTSIVNNPSIVTGFKNTCLPVVGDDLLSQVGATAVHIGLLEFLHSRGVKIKESYQLDVGGGSESINTLEKTRETKRQIKTDAVMDALPYDFPIVSGSADFVDFLVNGRDSFFYIMGTYFGGASFTMDVKLSTFDAPNSGAVLLDVIRSLKIAIDKGVGGAIESICCYGFKRPPKRYSISEAHNLFKRFYEDFN